MSEEAYTFHLKFRFQDGHRIGVEEKPSILGNILGKNLTLEGNKIDADTWLVIRSEPYNSYDVALNAVNITMDALRLYAIIYRFGIYFDNENVSILSTHKINATIEFNSSAIAFVIVSPDNLKTVLNLYAIQHSPLCDEIRLAIDLFSKGKNITSPLEYKQTSINQARFILLWSAFEALFRFAPKIKQPQEIKSYIEILLENIKKSELEDEAKKYLTQKIGDIKNDNTKDKISSLVNEYLENENSNDLIKQLHEIYELRNIFVHGSTKIQEEIVKNKVNELSSYIIKLEEILSDLINSIIKKHNISS